MSLWLTFGVSGAIWCFPTERSFLKIITRFLSWSPRLLSHWKKNKLRKRLYVVMGIYTNPNLNNPKPPPWHLTQPPRAPSLTQRAPRGTEWAASVWLALLASAPPPSCHLSFLSTNIFLLVRHGGSGFACMSLGGWGVQPAQMLTKAWFCLLLNPWYVNKSNRKLMKGKPGKQHCTKTLRASLYYPSISLPSN